MNKNLQTSLKKEAKQFREYLKLLKVVAFDN
jgi:hypothetical protein